MLSAAADARIDPIPRPFAPHLHGCVFGTEDHLIGREPTMAQRGVCTKLDSVENCTARNASIPMLSVENPPAQTAPTPQHPRSRPFPVNLLADIAPCGRLRPILALPFPTGINPDATRIT